MADRSSSATASSTVHTKCPSGTQSRTDGGIRNTCSRSPPMNLAPMPQRLPTRPDVTPFPDSLRVTSPSDRSSRFVPARSSSRPAAWPTTHREKHGVQEQGCEVDVVEVAAAELLEALAQLAADPRGGRLRELAEPGLLAQR